jgi:arginine decarboxylase
VSYNKDDLVAKLRKSTEVALRNGRLSLDESRQLLRMYEEGLSGYTYLEREVDASFVASNGQLRLVAQDGKSPVSPTGTGT